MNLQTAVNNRSSKRLIAIIIRKNLRLTAVEKPLQGLGLTLQMSPLKLGFTQVSDSGYILDDFIWFRLEEDCT